MPARWIGSAVQRCAFDSRLNNEQRRTYSLFAAIFFCTLVGYWTVRPLKLGVFVALVGLENEPAAKIGTMIVIIPMLFVYNTLVSRLENPRMLASAVCGTYAIVFVLLSVLLNMPTHGLNSGRPPSASNWLGWIVYWTVESFGSIAIPMYWSLVAKASTTESAKMVYALLTSVCQVGAICGASLATMVVTIGFQQMFFLQGCSLFFILLIIQRLRFPSFSNLSVERDYEMSIELHDVAKKTDGRTPSVDVTLSPAGSAGQSIPIAAITPKSDGVSESESENELTLTERSVNQRQVATMAPAGTPTPAMSPIGSDLDLSAKATGVKDHEAASPTAYDGLLLIFSRKYVFCVAVVSTAIEVVLVLMDLQMKFIAKEQFPDPKEFARFMGYFGQAVNVSSFIVSIAGAKWLIGRLGVGWSLLITPMVCAAIIGLTFHNPILWVYFGGLVLVKASGYAVNNPTKEMLYVKTHESVKFKAKSWIDMFGARGAKAFASSLNGLMIAWGQSAHAFRMYCSMASGGLVVFWLLAARFVGALYEAAPEGAMLT